MVQVGFIARRSRRVAGLLLGLWAPVFGCSPEVSEENPQDADDTIGAYCDALLPALCTHAVDTCGAEGPVARCVDNARAICCQGACSRPAKLVKDLEACKVAYAERPCGEVLAGLSPEACSEVVELLAQREVEGTR
ncbi:MAG: hypothetical protein MUF64_17255 [Polyangiaceae bacterium]|nr:hypothetical protein [Polyangiaceae bacterium]